MGYYWYDFLKDINKDFLINHSLVEILECFYKYCNMDKESWVELYSIEDSNGK